MIVWPVSSSVRTWNVGSSSDSAPSALPSLSWSILVFGSMATEITGSGNSIRSSTIGCAGSQSVSPVVVFLRPTAATMSPANTPSLSSRWLACIWRMRPTRSFLSLVALSTAAARAELARVDAEVGELADVGVAHDLERERRERLVVVGGALDRLTGLDVDALDRRDVERARQVVDDRVEQGLHALVLERRAAEHGHDLAAHRRGAHAVAQVVGGDLLVADVLLEHVLVELADDVDELVAPVLGVGLELGGDLDGLVALAHRRRPRRAPSSGAGRRRPGSSLSAPIGSCASATVGVEPVLDHVDAAEEVGADAVHLVDEAHPRHVVLVGLPPHGLGLGLDAGDRVEDRDRAVEHAQRPLDLDREVDVAGRVDDVDPRVAPLAGRWPRW